jgi:signal transduction histidine kinase
MGPAYAALNRFHRWLLLLLPAILALAGAGGYWISRRALTPVDEITCAVQAITVQSLDKRLPLSPADDELRRLASTFNDVLARLQAAVGDMVRFTADASHELRTPVSLVRTTAEIALRHERMPREYRVALSEVLDHARSMSVLVDDLLVLARTDAGIEPRAREPIDVRGAAAEAIREAEDLARERSVNVRLDTDSQSMTIGADPVSLRRLLLILLDNAVKYSRPGGTVDVRVSAESRARDGIPVAALLEVADGGIGLEEAETPRLFERFFRGARARQHAPEGTGLGLAIARTIVEGLGGTIRIENRTDGPGCSVLVQLPAQAPAERRAASTLPPVARESTG